MFFQKKLKKPSREEEEEFRQQIADMKIGWKDRFAMTISAFAVLFVPAAVVIILLCLICLALFGVL